MAVSRGHALRNYVIRRLLLIIPTMVGITFFLFILTRFVPGGPLDQARMQMLGAGGGGEVSTGGGSTRGGGMAISEEQMAVLSSYYGFDRPIHVQYFSYMWNLMRFDLGDSTRFSKPVFGLIAQRFPISLYYGIITTILTYGICIPLGILKAIRHKTTLDNTTSILVFIGYAVPNYALGAVLISLLSVKFDLFPLGGFKSEGFDTMSLFGKFKDLLWHSVLPLACYMIGAFAFMTMLMKNSLIENMSADYVKTALAKGMTWRRAVFVHALRNSLIPLATSFGNNISLLLAGSLLVETVFNIPGMGWFFFDSLQNRDYPLVMGITVISALLLLVGNLLSDLCVALVDPRVRFE